MLHFDMFFFFNTTAPTEIYTLSLHDALPISDGRDRADPGAGDFVRRVSESCDQRSDVSPHFHGDFLPASNDRSAYHGDRKSTRLNSSHTVISYAVFCLKKKIYQQWYHATVAD